MIYYKGLVFILVFFFTKNILGQQQELRTLMLEQFNINNNLKTTFDGGYYKGCNLVDWTRWGIRNATSYKINEKISVDIGFMYNRTVTTDESVQNEFRPHQSVKLTAPILPKMKLTHRFRMEEQFYTYNNSEGNKNVSRFRYEIKTKNAFNLKKNIESQTTYWIASSEFFFNPAGKIQDDYILFNRGRYGLGIGYKINNRTALEGSLLYQHTHSNKDFKDYSDIAIFNIYIRNSLFSK